MDKKTEHPLKQTKKQTKDSNVVVFGDAAEELPSMQS